MIQKLKFYEFFAGGGMVRAGLGCDWECKFANDFDGKKALTYQDNWGTSGELFVGDIRNITLDMLPTTADLAWGSFPCQDLSLAGGGAGLKGERSGTFYPFWDVLHGLLRVGRGPRIVALENVCGTLTSHGGDDFRSICQTFSDAGYRYGALIIDAIKFVPQSRPRLFVVGVRSDIDICSNLTSSEPILPFHTRSLQNAVCSIGASAAKNWKWWNLPSPPLRISSLSEIIQENPTDVEWHSKEKTEGLLSTMSPTNRAKVTAAMRAGRTMVGSIYKRTRVEKSGRIVRAEVRFDDVSGCLRTPNGGSSRQTILIVDGQEIRSRLISARETARLMGLEESYRLPKNYNQAYHLTGDGVVVPVVSYLAKHLFRPILHTENQADFSLKYLQNKER